MTPAGESILILGFGELGAAMLHAIASRMPSTRLTVLLRQQAVASPSPEKHAQLQELHAMGIEFVTADLAADTPEALSKVFARFDTIIGCTGFASGVPIQRKVCLAILEAGVRRYVPWQFGVDYDVIGRGSAQDLFDEQLDVRDLLRAQTATEWIIISTGMFTSFLFQPELGVVDITNIAIHALGSFDTAITVTTAHDIANLTAEVLLAEPRIRNSVVYVAGDTLTYEQLAQTLEKVLGRKLFRKVRSIPELEDALARDPGDAMSKYRVVFAQGRGVSWNKSLTFNASNNLAVTDVEQWTQEHFRDSTLQSGA